MNLKSLHCPKCGAALEIEDGIDTFYCKYCGYKIILEGQTDATINAKVRVKEMEHEEKIKDKEYAYKIEKTRQKEKTNRLETKLLVGLNTGLFAFMGIMLLFGLTGAKRQEKELQATVDEIMVDIKNEDFADAYVKANTLYWDDSWTDDGEEKWDATRKEIIKQIEDAEKKATGTTTHESEKEDKGGFFNWFK